MAGHWSSSQRDSGARKPRSRLPAPYANIMKSFASTNPMTPHAGKVMTHASSMFFAIPQFTRLNDFEAPTPMMAEVLQWLVAYVKR